MDQDMLLRTTIIRKRYNRIAWFYDWLDKMMIPDSVRQRAIVKATGKVLEVGVGTGKNLPYYRKECDVTGIDFSPSMLDKARQKAHFSKRAATLMEMDAQHMNFQDGTFDTVVATCVFCSVPDPMQGLREVRRVCKSGGKIILLEHVRSENQLFGCLMDILNPVYLHLIGCNINRRTVENVRTAGIDIRRIEDIDGKIVKLIVARP